MTGVDISLERLSACRTVVSKYKCHNTTLVLGDGTTFDAPPPSLDQPPLHRRTTKMSRRKRRATLPQVPHCTCVKAELAIGEVKDDDKDDGHDAGQCDDEVDAEVVEASACTHRILHRATDFHVARDGAQGRLYDKASGNCGCDVLIGAGAGGRRLHARRVAQGYDDQ